MSFIGSLIVIGLNILKSIATTSDNDASSTNQSTMTDAEYASMDKMAKCIWDEPKYNPYNT